MAIHEPPKEERGEPEATGGHGGPGDAARTQVHQASKEGRVWANAVAALGFGTLALLCGYLDADALWVLGVWFTFLGAISFGRL